jgi:hypothetical protein
MEPHLIKIDNILPLDLLLLYRLPISLKPLLDLLFVLGSKPYYSEWL